MCGLVAWWLGLVDWCLTALSAQTGYIVPQEYETYYVGQGDKTENKKLVPWGTDGRLPLSDLDLGSGHTAYRRASLIDLYLRTKFH